MLSEEKQKGGPRPGDEQEATDLYGAGHICAVPSGILNVEGAERKTPHTFFMTNCD